MVRGGDPIWPPCYLPRRIYNLGNSKPVNLLAFIETMEKAFGQLAIKKMYPMQPGDVERTYADVEDLKKEFGYQPETGITEGILVNSFYNKHSILTWSKTIPTYQN